MEKQVMNTKEAAKYIGISYSYMRQIRAQGPIEGRLTPPPVHYIDSASQKTALYLKDEVDKWLKSLPTRFALEPEPGEFSDER
ncbi:MAG: hypothetical protein PHC36_07235 [Eubacteriales bacterium]|jgi:hypothetical protein|nr:hypothetical protein [Eubacteriales bacterium]